MKKSRVQKVIYAITAVALSLITIFSTTVGAFAYFTVMGFVYLYSNFIDIIKNNQFDEIRFMNERGYGNGISYKAGM